MVGVSLLSASQLTTLDLVKTAWTEITGNPPDAWLYVLVSFLVFALLNILYQPAKMYDELGGFLTTPFKLVPRPPKPVGNPIDYRYASIDVKNWSGFHIENCFLKLVWLIDLNTGKSILQNDNRKFDWGSSHSETEEKSSCKTQDKLLSAHDKGICDFAETRTSSNKLARFTFWRGYQDVEPGRYELG